MSDVDPVKCACPRCQCRVSAGEGVIRDGNRYCSQTCAHECTETTCVCVHDCCEEHDDKETDVGINPEAKD